MQSKLPNVGTTIFTVMSSLAAEHKAINLGQGFPDFNMSSELTDLVNKAMQAGHNQYVHMNGLPALRERLAEKVKKLYNNEIDFNDEITITPGGTYAIYTAFTTVLQKGDEVIVFEPAYDSYIPNIEINGAIAIPVSLSYPDYSIDWALVKTKLTPKTKAIIINSPHNPSGAVLSENDLQQLSELVKDTGIFIISDEVYEHLVFDGKKHLSVLKYPELYERSFVCFSFGKVYHCTGWKMGYCIAPPALMKEFRKVHQFNCFTCNSPAQYALASFLEQEDQYLQLGNFLQQKRDFLLNAMAQTRFKPLPSHGSYFQLYSYADISDEKENEFAIRLVKDFGVATIPVSAFYKTAVDNKVVRFCFAKKESTLEQAVKNLQKLN
ncbi:MAG: aminotransferase class I/II-fold pyridoxal phosphate-dependent enzyme [Sphingobacteriales bacterium]|nr:MAG: aminotransferase class I/II-fold pyridoxal phosphate-dependent enzyme [Sphingobacteriales bacterium]